jgi:hypothetical protein
VEFWVFTLVVGPAGKFESPAVVDFELASVEGVFDGVPGWWDFEFFSRVFGVIFFVGAHVGILPKIPPHIWVAIFSIFLFLPLSVVFGHLELF